MRKLLALVALFPVAVLAGPIGPQPGSASTASSYASSVTSGHGFKLKQGAGICFNSTTCTADIVYDGTDMVVNLPASKGFQIEVNNSDMFTLSSAGAGVFTSSVSADSFNLATSKQLNFNAGATTHIQDESGALVFDVASAKTHSFDVNGTPRLVVTGSGADVTGTLTASTGLTIPTAQKVSLNVGATTNVFDTSGVMEFEVATGKTYDFQVNNATVATIGSSSASYISPGTPICYTASCGSNIDDSSNGTMNYTSGSGATAQAHIFKTGVTHTGTTSIFEIENNGTTVLDLNQAGKLKLTTGAGGCSGTATLVGGTVTVSTTCVNTGDLIFTSRNTTGGTAGHLSAPVASISDGTSFVINSSSGTDTSTVNWWVVDN